jgi:DNA-binding NarL/FixJ family response regulator
MDIRMPRRDGLQATRRLLERSATTRVIILTTYDLDEYVFEAITAGAAASC